MNVKSLTLRCPCVCGVARCTGFHAPAAPAALNAAELAAIRYHARVTELEAECTRLRAGIAERGERGRFVKKGGAQ